MNTRILLVATLLLVPLTAHAGDTPTAPRVGGTSRPLPEASTTRQAGQRCVLGVCTGMPLVGSGSGSSGVPGGSGVSSSGPVPTASNTISNNVDKGIVFVEAKKNTVNGNTVTGNTGGNRVCQSGSGSVGSDVPPACQ